MSARLTKARELIHEVPLQEDVRSQLRDLEEKMDELEKFEMQYLWEVLIDTEDQQGLIVDES